MLGVLTWVLVTRGAAGVLFPGGRGEAVERQFEDGVGACLRVGEPVLPCLTTGAVQALDTADTAPDLRLDEGLALVRHDTEMGPGMRGTPRDARSLFEGLEIYMEKRSLEWDLGILYPGLLLKVGPQSKNYLHFQLDPVKTVDDRSLSTGRLLMKRTLLPILLGLKLNLAALTPLIFGALILITKKALFLSKLSFLFSGLSLLGGDHTAHVPHPHAGHVGGLHSFGHPSGYREPLIIEGEVPWLKGEDKIF